MAKELQIKNELFSDVKKNDRQCQTKTCNRSK